MERDGRGKPIIMTTKLTSYSTLREDFDINGSLIRNKNILTGKIALIAIKLCSAL